jgi:hypothetical protein
MEGRHLRVMTREHEPHVLDRAGFANARGAVDERPHDPVAQAARDELVECLDRRRGDAVIARNERVQRRVDRTRNLQRHEASVANDSVRKPVQCRW